MDACWRTAEKAVPAASSMDVSETVAELPMPAPKVGTCQVVKLGRPTLHCMRRSLR
jgi:hypothetical protein